MTALNELGLASDALTFITVAPAFVLCFCQWLTHDAHYWQAIGGPPEMLVQMLWHSGEGETAKAKHRVAELTAYLASYTGSMELTVSDAEAQPVIEVMH